jgi:hypothetical protein
MFLPSSRRPLGALGLFALALLAAGTGASAARPVELPPELTPAERTRLQPVADTATLTTRVTAEPFAARRDVFEFLLDHPEFATHVTRALNVARYKIWREPDGLHLDDGWGAHGWFEVVHATPGLRVMYARGEYQQRFLPDITGDAIVVLEYDSRSTSEGEQILSTVAGYVRVDSRFYAAASRLASGLAAEKAEREARRLMKVFMKVSRAIAEDPGGVYELVRQRDGVPKAPLETFRTLLSLPRTVRP